jgi:hypothetical protein
MFLSKFSKSGVSFARAYIIEKLTNPNWFMFAFSCIFTINIFLPFVLWLGFLSYSSSLIPPYSFILFFAVYSSKAQTFCSSLSERGYKLNPWKPSSLTNVCPSGYSVGSSSHAALLASISLYICPSYKTNRAQAIRILKRH